MIQKFSGNVDEKFEMKYNLQWNIPHWDWQANIQIDGVPSESDDKEKLNCLIIAFRDIIAKYQAAIDMDDHRNHSKDNLN